MINHLYKLLKKYFWLYNAVSAVLYVSIIYSLIILWLNILAVWAQLDNNLIFALKNFFPLIISFAIIIFIIILLKTEFYNFKSFIILFEKSSPELAYKISSVYTAFKSNPSNPFTEKLIQDIAVNISRLKLEYILRPVNGRINRALIIIVLGAAFQGILFKYNYLRLIDFIKNCYKTDTVIEKISFNVSPGSIAIIKGESVNILIKPISYEKKISSVDLTLVSNGDHEKITLTNREQTRDTFSYSLKNIISNVEYYISAEKFISKRYLITAYTKPVINIEYIKIMPPQYSNIETDILYSFHETIEILKGSEIEIKCNINFEPEKFFIKYGNFSVRYSEKNNRNYIFRYKPFSEGTISFYFESKLTIPAETRKKINISVKPDLEPAVNFEFPGKEEFVLPDDMLAYFIVAAEDDFGISSGNLYFFNDIIKDTFQLDFRKTALNHTAYYTIDFSKYDVMPGDEIFYYADAYDNDAVSGFKKAVTKKFKLKVPSVADLFNELNKEFNYSTNVMNAIQAKNEDISKSAKKLINDLMKSNSSDWSTQKQIKELLDAQKKIEAEIKEIQSRISKAVEQYKKTREMLGEETLEKLSKLNKLMDELRDNDIKKSITDFQNALASKNPMQQQEFLKNAVFNKDEFGKKIDRTLSLLNRLKMQNTLKNIQKTIDDLKFKQNDITSSINKNDLESGAIQQEKLASELSKLQQAVDDLKNSSEDKQTQKVLDNIKETMAKINQQSKKLANNMKNQKSGTESEVQKNKDEMEKESNDLKEKLSNLAEQLNNLLTQMSNKEFEKFEQDIETIIFKMINLQNKNLELKNNFEDILRETNNQFINSVPADYPFFINLCQEYQNYIYIQSAKYFQLTAKSFVFPADLIEDFKYISDMYGYICDSLKNKSSAGSLDKINIIMKSTSSLIFKLLKIKEDLNKDNQKNNSSNMSDRLEQLAKAQQSLNSMSFNFNDLSQEQIEQMSYEQSLIRQSLEQLMDSNTNSGDALQQKLQKLVDEMNKIEKTLKKGTLNQQVKESQKSVYDKLIDTSRSLKKETENQDKRESKAALEVKPKSAPPVDLKKSSGLPVELEKFLNNSMPDYYKKELNEYYKSLLKLYEIKSKND
ncbi:hypothetical protein KA977_06110 [Candidatus Dependentiae bacterium]|nr:hypothetical protein [Candidatus Dependentiae bacterium]